ncbi:MAG: hypothetical protein R3B74_07175 [Nitrospirales bacterium]|nr:hypothetical protein [Nitrospirales bacterium]
MSDFHWKDKFPRHYKLFSSSDQSHPDYYFSVPSVRQALENRSPNIQSMEEKFQVLTSKAWKQFVEKTKPFLIKRDQWGYHSQLWQLFNEVEGYLYLERMGYANIEFIEETQGKTPDLLGNKENGNAILEVKTIRESDASYNYLHSKNPYKGAIKSTQTIPQGFKNKIKKTIENGADQLNSYPNQGHFNKILLIIFCPDIGSHSSTVIDKVKKIVSDCAEEFQGIAIECQTDSAYPIH